MKKVIIVITGCLIILVGTWMIWHINVKNRMHTEGVTEILYTDSQSVLSQEEKIRLDKMLYNDSVAQKGVPSSTSQLKIYTE
ncbi:MAG: hypothetical protein RIQ72_684 [Candidatus Parcubacteria bacterium]|jgi:uncharacterized protein YxeA